MNKFSQPFFVGRPNIFNKSRFLERVDQIFDRRWLSNDGPLVQEFENKIQVYTGAKHCVALCNATIGLEIAIRALGLKGEVIIPSYTFVATAHALTWLGIRPVFADIDPLTHNLDPREVEKLITPDTSAIIGVHLWGRPCDPGLESVALKYGLKIMYDAAHAFGCSRDGVMVGNFGECEVFSFHATKFLNCFEGGAIVTNNDELAEKIRLMRNFGFSGYDNVISIGTNGKMSEISAAMGLSNLESIHDILAINQRNYNSYTKGLSELPGISLIQYNSYDNNNYQYIIIEVNSEVCPRSRDQIIEQLHANNVIARKYFWPGCHKMEPYRSLEHNIGLLLPATERIAQQVIVLPTGQNVSNNDIDKIISIIKSALSSI